MPILTSRDHDDFLESGCVALRGVVPLDVCSHAAATLESEDQESPAATAAVAACNTEALRGAVGELFGPQYDFDPAPGFRDMQRPHEPEAEWPSPCAHVDDSYPILMPDGWAIGSFLFLTRVKSRGGAFIYFPGSPWRYRRATVEDGNSLKGIAPLKEHSGAHEEFLAEPGDAILFHHLMGHCGSPNVADTATRHALLTRWRPRHRIVPGHKPFAEMTTIEKANSSLFLKSRFAPDLQLSSMPPAGVTEDALHGGFGINTGQIVSYDVLSLDGLAHLFYVESDAPRVIHHMCSSDLINWQDAGSAPIDEGPVRSLHFHRYEGDVMLAVTIEGQRSAGEPPRVTLFSSPDLKSWKQVDMLSTCNTCTPWFLYAKYPSKIASGQTLYTVAPSTPHRVECRWAETWGDGDSWTNRSIALEALPTCRIRDVTVASRYRDSHSAFVVDLESDGGEWDDTRPHYTLPEDVAVAGENLEPLAFSAPTPPRLIRLLQRARSYWLVSYVRTHAGVDRFFWGEIDWEETPPTLRELSTIADFDRARCIVGMT